MHQMRISTTKVSSVVLRPEKSWKSENSGKEPKIPKRRIINIGHNDYMHFY
jgi:hypothetical protein